MMDPMQVVKTVANKTNTPITHIGVAMGKRPNYVSVAINKGTTPNAELLARMLDVCGYGLFAIPYGSEPPSALRITADKD